MSPSKQGLDLSPVQRAPRQDSYQIGEIVERTKLSLRTVRYYEEAGLLAPVGRTPGGFRLYDDETLDRLAVIKRMKPLGFTLEEMRVLIELRERLASAQLPARERHDLIEQLAAWSTLAEKKLEALQEQVAVAKSFVTGLTEDSRRWSAPSS